MASADGGDGDIPMAGPGGRAGRRILKRDRISGENLFGSFYGDKDSRKPAPPYSVFYLSFAAVPYFRPSHLYTAVFTKAPDVSFLRNSVLAAGWV